MVRTCLMNMEFDKLKDTMDNIIINTAAVRDHMGDIKQYICVVKEQGCSITSQLPYKKCMPDQLVIHLIKFVVMWLNTLPHQTGVSQILSPQDIIMHIKMDSKKHCRVKLGHTSRQAPMKSSPTLCMAKQRNA